jgi:hypothetical protein
MSKNLEEKDWDTLLKRINAGKCTPFLGAGACAGVLPLGGEISKKWADIHGYPLEDCHDLARVAQFLAVDRDDAMFAKDEIAILFKDVAPPDFNEPDEPHGVLADLPLPVYITTNYDDFMVQALKSRKKDPEVELCLWNKYIKDQPSIFNSEPNFKPTQDRPVVFHLHGYKELTESLVLAEDDYLDFLVNISRDQTLLPPQIQRALTGASLLFIGYQLADWNFRVIFRGLIDSMEASLRRLSIAVQLPPEQEMAQKYLTKYFKNAEVRVYWGKAREFSAELKERWKKFKLEDEKNDI